MNQPDSLERLLRKQPLRQPSAKVYSRLFGSEPAEPFSWWDSFAEMRRWFLPASSALALAIIALSPQHPAGQDPFRGPIALSASGEVVHAKFERFFSEHNTLPSQTLEWTFGAARPSPAPALLAFTNSLLTQ